ncbi:hypothetical protein BDAP_002548, partial [Binucleata daphniae]
TRSGKKIENLLKAEKAVENKTSNVADSAVVGKVPQRHPNKDPNFPSFKRLMLRKRTGPRKLSVP